MSFFKKFFPNKKRNSLNPNDFVHIEDDKPSSTNNDNTNANNNKRNTISSPPVHNYPQPSVIHVAPSSPSHIPSHIEHDQPSQPIISSNPLPPPKPVYTSSIQRNKVSCPYCYLSMYDQNIYTRHVNECPSRPDKQPNQPPPYNAAVSMPNLNLYHPPQPANSAPPGFIQTSPIVPSPASLSYNSLPSHNPQYMVYNQPSAPALDARPYTAPAINPRPVARIVSYGTNNQPMARQPLARNNNKWTSSSLDTSPFAVNCPYPGCGLKMEAKDFVSHANSNHSHLAQNFSCPICPLLGYISYAVKPDTNLLQHLKSRHSDLANAAVQSQPVAKKPTTQQFDDFVYDPSQFGEDDYDPSQFDDIPFDPEELKSKIGSHYVEDTIKEYKTGWECSICYEDFEVGTTIARMDCFCVFHKKCIDDWLKKAKKCPLHKD